MAGAIINSVSDDTEGRVAGIGNGVSRIFECDCVPRGGVERSAEGNQTRLRTHDRRILTSGCTRRRVGGSGLGT
jgi:hypothetical protein